MGRRGGGGTRSNPLLHRGRRRRRSTAQSLQLHTSFKTVRGFVSCSFNCTELSYIQLLYCSVWCCLVCTAAYVGWGLAIAAFNSQNSKRSVQSVGMQGLASMLAKHASKGVPEKHICKEPKHNNHQGDLESQIPMV